MTDLARMRTLVRGGAAGRPQAPGRVPAVDLETLAAGLGGRLEEAPLGPGPVVRWWLGGPEPDELYGDRLGWAARAMTAEGVRVLSGDHGAGATASSLTDPTEGLVFFDLETTGLSGGAGTVAFVVGFGRFDGGRFHVWQLVLPSFAGERRLLAAVAAAVSSAHTLVTFNGKSFDVPFMEMRWLFHRLETPFARLRHLDLLHPARRLWGPDTGGLGGLERHVLGVERRDDVPGFEIPSRYFDFLRSGDPAPLRGVLAHNRLDLASLAVLTGLACELVDGGSDGARDARQCLGLGRVYERGGRPVDAHRCYERAAGGTFWRRPAAESSGDRDVQAEALYRVALARRRQRRHADAAGLWQDLLALGRPPGRYEREALRALAVHHEHRVKDAERALTFARLAYREARTTYRRRDGQRRVMRLERRLAQGGRASG